MVLNRGVRQQAAPAGGFTLLELLIVLVLLGIGATMAVVSIDRLLQRADSLRWFDKAEQSLHKMKNRALLSGRPVRGMLDAEHNEILLDLPEGGSESFLQLPSSYTLTLTAQAQGKGSATFFFFPDGSASEMTFEVRDRTDRAYRFRIAGVTGRISRHDVSAQ